MVLLVYDRLKLSAQSANIKACNRGIRFEKEQYQWSFYAHYFWHSSNNNRCCRRHLNCCPNKTNANQMGRDLH